MTVITEHDTEKERESYNGEGRGVSFLVRGDTVGVRDQLQGINDVVGFEVGWRLKMILFPIIVGNPGLELD